MNADGDLKMVDGIEYEWRGKALGWQATGRHAPGITNTPHRGEPEKGSRARRRAPVGPSAGEPPAARLETDSAKRKEYPLYSGLIRYFPDALAEVARLSLEATKKHHPNEPMHWARSKSTDHLDCLVRHLAEAGTLDEDQFLHDVKIAWRALASLQTLLEKLRGLPISPGSRP